jgi:hypothetical protein
MSTIPGQPIPAQMGVTLLARIRGVNGAYITQASVVQITWTVLDVTAGVTLGTGSFTTTAAIYDSLQQQDPRWERDTAANPGPDGAWGYNFAATLPASLFPATLLAAPDPLAGGAQGHEVHCEVVFTPVQGQPFRLLFIWQTVPSYAA